MSQRDHENPPTKVGGFFVYQGFEPGFEQFLERVCKACASEKSQRDHRKPFRNERFFCFMPAGIRTEALAGFELSLERIVQRLGERKIPAESQKKSLKFINPAIASMNRIFAFRKSSKIARIHKNWVSYSVTKQKGYN
jgi:hypothetical protein